MSDHEGDQEIEEFLYESEERIDEVRIDGVRIVATNRRLFVTRERGEPRLRAVDRANLGEIRVRTESDTNALVQAAQWGGLGAFFILVWLFVPLEGLVRPVDPPTEGGFDDMLGPVNALLTLFSFLDEAFLAGGVLALGWAAVRVGWYLYGRRTRLEIGVAGEEPIEIPAASDETVGQLRELVDSLSSPESG